MYSGDGHTLWMNSCALKALGVTRDSVAPQGGSYDRDENGELTGIVREAAAMELLPRCLAWLSERDIARAYEAQMAHMAEQGITSICDMALMPHEGCDFIRDDVYEALAQAGKLIMRVHMYPTLLDDQSRLEGLQERYAREEFSLLRAPGFKQFFDGVSSQHTGLAHRAIYQCARAWRLRPSHGARRAHARSGVGCRRAWSLGAHPHHWRPCHSRGARHLRGGTRTVWGTDAGAQHARAPREPAARGYRALARSWMCWRALSRGTSRWIPVVPSATWGLSQRHHAGRLRRMRPMAWLRRSVPILPSRR